MTAAAQALALVLLLRLWLMNEKGIDWYKAAIEAAQNGQTAALELAEQRTKEFQAYQESINKILVALRIGGIMVVTIAFIVGIILGGVLF